VAGVAGLVAGAMSMAAGEVISVSSTTDAEQARPLARERERSFGDSPLAAEQKEARSNLTLNEGRCGACL